MDDNPITPSTESDRQTRPEKPWYRLSLRAWTLLGTLLLLNVVNVLYPGLLGSVFRNMDIRLWPGWYFAVLAAALFVSVVWYWGTGQIRSTAEKENKS